MQCPSCGARVTPGGNFCELCGVPLPRPCPSCAHVNSANARFCGRCGARVSVDAPSSPIASAAQAAPPRAVGTRAERRHLTVMFCDMVGSTALSTRLDPEEQRELIAAFQTACANQVKRFGGTIAQYFGDGVLAYFGSPVAHEDDAERAVRAGLAIVETVGRFRRRRL